MDGLLGEGGAGGKPSAVRCRLELLRLAAGHVLECSEADMQAAVKAHIQQQRRGKAPANLQQGMVGAAAAGDASSGPDGTETPLPHSPDVASKAAVHALAAQGETGSCVQCWSSCCHRMYTELRARGCTASPKPGPFSLPKLQPWPYYKLGCTVPSCWSCLLAPPFGRAAMRCCCAGSWQRLTR